MNSVGPSVPRIFLSPPDISPIEQELVQEAFATNWVAPAGPHLGAFEKEMCAYSGAGAAVCVSSGTAALHLAAHILGIGRGDEVMCSTFTFAASANPIVYEGGTPIFVDSGEEDWNMDPSLLADALARRARLGRLPKAVIVADIYGQSANWPELLKAVQPYEIPIIEDAAEAVGAIREGRHAGTWGQIAIYSFNGNKVLTTAGGGMVLSPDQSLVDRAHHLATQAREPAPHYEHKELGFNYRLSNVLAAIGRGQLRGLEARIARRRAIFNRYRRELGELPGVAFMPEPADCRSTRWLTCLTIDPAKAPTDRETVRVALDAENIEARPLWKPLHLQPVFSGCAVVGRALADRLFEQGLCLPSGSSLTEEEQSRVIEVVQRAFNRR